MVAVVPAPASVSAGAESLSTVGSSCMAPPPDFQTLRAETVMGRGSWAADTDLKWMHSHAFTY